MRAQIRTLVIAGLDPAIHLFERMDARASASPKGLWPRRRVEPAHDDLKTMRELNAKAGI
jgi:hypothetical protein